MSGVQIGHRRIGPGQPCLVIAEAGANHNSDRTMALRLIEEAARAGADAIKFQTYSAARLVTRDAPKYYVDTMEQWRRGDAPVGCQFDEFQHLDSMARDTYHELAARCAELGILFMSTPFDEEAVDLLDEIGVPAFKIASGDLTAHPFVRYVAARQRPLLLSTGCSTLDEIEEALEVVYSTGNRQVALMHCTLAYPCDFPDVNLAMMTTLRTAFPDVPVGLSDHTLGTLVPALAASHGACVVEKHFTLDKALPTSTDHFMSVDPAELASLVRDVRAAEASLGQPLKAPVAAERLSRLYARRSVVAASPIAAGMPVRREQLTLKRPGTGIAPKFLDAVVGRRPSSAIAADTVITWDMLR